MNDVAASEAWLYSLRIPPLTLAEFRRCNALVTAPFLGCSLKPSFIWKVFLPSVLLGSLIGLVPVWLDMDLMIMLRASEPSFLWVWTGLWAVVILFAPVLPLLAFMAWVRRVASRPLLQRIHAGSANLHEWHDLLLSEERVCWRNAVSTIELRWRAITALSQEGDMHILRFAGLNYMWLPDSAFASLEERQTVLDFIRARIAASPPIGAVG